MISNEALIGETLPLLASLSVLREGDDHLPGYYDTRKNVWVVDGPNGPFPIIQVNKDLGELGTKTFVERERDDADYMHILEISTKTDQKMERDDVQSSMASLLDLFTKTKAEPERDD